ncbi:PilZ domain-containing protein [Campylobacter sp.]|uniref:PilZ domain-containing protein n=1 Tax=Campylobacter sp. TaxID=205 RepID=UPI003FA16382
MDFKGRQELVMNCEDSILKLRAKFIDDGIKFCRQLTFIVPHDQVKICLENIFDTLLIQIPNFQQLQDDLNNLIPKSNTKDELVNFLLLNLILSFSRSCDNSTFVGYFVNAVSRMKEILCSSKGSQETAVKTMIDTGMFFYEDPINTFTRMKNAKVKPEFLNLYDGLNIKYEAEILEVKEDSVVFRVDMMQILAMKQDGKGFILPNSFFSKPLCADIVNYNIVNKGVTLSNFLRNTSMYAYKRKFQRILPNRFTKIFIKGKQGNLEGSLYDISEGGISVLSSQTTNFQHGEEVEANFDILMEPDKSKSVSLKLKLVTELAYKGYIRYCLELTKDDETIKDFTQRRIKETLDELRSRINLYE